VEHHALTALRAIDMPAVRCPRMGTDR